MHFAKVKTVLNQTNNSKIAIFCNRAKNYLVKYY